MSLGVKMKDTENGQETCPLTYFCEQMETSLELQKLSPKEKSIIFKKVDTLFIKFLEKHFEKITKISSFKSFTEGATPKGWAKLESHGFFMNWAYNPNKNEGKYYSFPLSLGAKSSIYNKECIHPNTPLIFSDYYHEKSNAFKKNKEYIKLAKLLNLPALIFLAELSHKSLKEIDFDLNNQKHINSFKDLDITKNIISYETFNKHITTHYLLPNIQNIIRRKMNFNYKTLDSLKKIFDIYIKKENKKNTLEEYNRVLLLEKHIESPFTIAIFSSFDDYHNIDSTIIDRLRFHREYYYSSREINLFNNLESVNYKCNRYLQRKIELLLSDCLNITSDSMLRSIALKLTDFVIQYNQNSSNLVNKSLYIYAFHEKLLNIYLDDNSRKLEENYRKEIENLSGYPSPPYLDSFLSDASSIFTAKDIQDYNTPQTEIISFLEKLDNEIGQRIENYDELVSISKLNDQEKLNLFQKVLLGNFPDLPEDVKKELPGFLDLLTSHIEEQKKIVEKFTAPENEFNKLIESNFSLYLQHIANIFSNEKIEGNKEVA